MSTPHKNCAYFLFLAQPPKLIINYHVRTLDHVIMAASKGLELRSKNAKKSLLVLRMEKHKHLCVNDWAW